MADFSFDTGDTVPMQTRLIEGYLSLLSPLLYDSGDTINGRGPYLKTLEQFSHTLNPRDFEPDAFASYLNGRTPSILVVYHGAKEDRSSPIQIDWDATVYVYVISGHGGKGVQGRINPDPYDDAVGDDPGLAVMTQHAIELLSYRSPDTDLPTRSIRVNGHQHLFTTASISVQLLDTSCIYAQTICKDRDAVKIDEIQADALKGVSVYSTQRRVLP